jgi:hypothetical protein
VVKNSVWVPKSEGEARDKYLINLDEDRMWVGGWGQGASKKIGIGPKCEFEFELHCDETNTMSGSHAGLAVAIASLHAEYCIDVSPNVRDES